MLPFILFSMFSAWAQEDSLVCTVMPVTELSDLASEITNITNKVLYDSLAEECPKRPPYPDQFSGINNLHDLKMEIEIKFRALGINPRWGDHLGAGTWERFRNNPEDRARLKRLANITYSALSQYPRNFLRNMNFRRVYFAKNLQVIGQMRKAMPAPESNALIYADNNDLQCEPGMELRVHHEFYHFLEGKKNGDMHFNDPSWAAMNDSKHQYSSNAAQTYSCAGGFHNTGHSQPGFVSRYATTAIEEDKAEVFAWMMTKGYGSRVQNWTLNDPILKNKVDYLQRFFNTQDNRMNADFFQRSTAE